MRKILFLTAALALAAGCSPKVVVLYDNDVHCSVDGYADMAARQKAEKQACKYVYTVSAGDFVQGGNLGAGTKGAYITAIMNKVGYDFVTLGNHEFDYGMPRQREITDELDAVTLDCNLIYIPDGKRLYDPYAIVRCGSKKIAFLGVSTPYSFVSSTPKFFQNEKGEYIYSLSVDTFYDTVQNMVDDARSRGADYVIALTHLGDDVEADPINSQRLIAATCGIDVVLDGHSHSTVERRILKNSRGEDVLMTSTGSHFENIGRLALEKGRFSSQLLPVTAVTPKDPEVERFVDSLKAEYNKQGSKIICVNRQKLLATGDGKRIVRLAQQPLGRLIAEAYRVMTGSDVGFIGGGSIRTDLPEGAVSHNDIFAIMPFGNEICTAEVPGSVIADILEFSVHALPMEFGGYQQVSGLTFDVNPDIPSPVVVDANNEFVKFDGGKRRVSNIRILNEAAGEYEPLDPGKIYKIAGTDYMLLNHGDGYNFTDEKTVRRTNLVDVQIFEQYIVDYLEGVIDYRWEYLLVRESFITPSQSSPKAKS